MCADTCESVIRLDNGLMVALSLVDGLGTLCGAGATFGDEWTNGLCGREIEQLDLLWHMTEATIQS